MEKRSLATYPPSLLQSPRQQKRGYIYISKNGIARNKYREYGIFFTRNRRINPPLISTSSSREERAGRACKPSLNKRPRNKWQPRFSFTVRFNAAAMYAYAERKVINAGAGGRSRSSTINQIKGWKREIKLAPVEKSGSTVVLASSSRSRGRWEERGRERENEKWRAWLICISEEPRVGHRLWGEAWPKRGCSASWPEKIHGVPLWVMTARISTFKRCSRVSRGKERVVRRKRIDSTTIEFENRTNSMNFRWN